MVSGETVRDPLHADLIQSRLSERRLAAGLPPLCNVRRGATKNSTCQQSRRSSPPPPPSSPPPSSGAADDLRPVRCSNQIKGLDEPGHRLGAASPSEEEEEGGEVERSEMKGKRHGGRGEAAMEDRLEDMADGPKNAKITLSFPLSAAPLPASLTSPNHCRSSSSSSSSPHRRRPSSKSSDEGSLWKLDATMDVKHRPFKPPRRDGSPSSSPSSSSSPMTVHALSRKDLKSPPPPKCSKLNPETQFHRSPPRSFSGSSGGCCGGGGGGDGWDERHRAANGTSSPSQTAQILFSLGAAAYQRGGDAERREKMTGRPAGKVGSPHGPSLHPPTLHLHLPPPLPPPPPPPPSEGLTAPPHSSCYPPADGPKPELICGVCHRLFSSASSLTVHMRLHRGSRALSCCSCGKVFIHSKRLQSHEASCRAPGPPSDSSPGPPALAVQPKEEPLEEGEVRVEGGVIVGQSDVGKARPGKKARSLLARIQGDDAAAAELLAGDEHHFVKVVDGNIIYFCSVCERSYMTLSSLKRHSNVHSWRRKYPCHFCDKVFALAEYRTKHEVWHTGERRYQCIFCWDAFATYYNLKTHQKTIHGINPSLISSEKTVNGGYKQKANALKLYRLLPMRSQKRPYKTYSDGLHNGLLLPPPETPSLSLPGPGCALGPGELQSLVGGAHPRSVKPDPDDFPDGFPVSAERGDLSALKPLPQADMPQVRKHESEAPELEQGRGSGSFKMSSSSKTKNVKTGRGTDTSTPSVITYGHTKPSVIVHGTAVSSSVIVHSNQVTSGSEKSPMSSPSPDTSSSQTSHKGIPRPVKKQRDGADGRRKRSRDRSDTAEQGSGGRHGEETGRLFHKSRKSHSRSDVSNSKHLSASVRSQVKETGPLCQITVRIGEEAIVKRSISETDLRRDKSLSPPKTKRSETSSTREAKETRHSHHHHHHHHHKHRLHRRDVLEEDGDKEGGDCEEEEEVREKSSKSPDEVREYYFRREVRDQESDNDTEDNLWRPYYSYKPKRKAQAHLQRVKSWQRKLKFKRSIRLKRTERLKKHANKEAATSRDEERDAKIGETEEPSTADGDEGDGEEGEHLSAPLKENNKDPEEEEEEVKAACREVPAPPAHSPTSPLSTSVAPPTGIKRRPWTNGNAAECGTCGCWFSSPRKRDKHELSHLLEFVCLFCRATFPSRDKLEDHQRARHPKPVEAPPAPQHVEGVGVKTVPEIAKYDEEKGGQVALAGCHSSPNRLSRRALSRHTCPQCHKVCKTSSALTRHIRRHELSSSPEREKEDKDPEPRTAEAVVNAVSRDLEAGTGPAPGAVSVISYSTPDPPGGGGDCLASRQRDGRSDEPADERRVSDSSGKPEAAELSPPEREREREREREPGPQIAEPPLESPVQLPPAKHKFTPASTLQSVLVMNGPECLDYRTPSRKSLDGHTHRTPSPASTSPNAPATSRTRITAAAPPVSMTTALGSEGGFAKRDGVIMDRERQGGSGVFVRLGYEEPPRIRDLGGQPLSRSPSPDEAQDLTMSSILAREREMERRRENERERERQRDKERGKEIERAHQMSRVAHSPQDQVSLLVPKEEPLSPVPSPQHLPTQTTMNGSSSHRHTPQPPCPATNVLRAQGNRHVLSSSQGLDRLPLPTGAGGAGAGDHHRPSAHALLLPRAPQPPEPERRDTAPSRESQRGNSTPVGYHAQSYPLPLIVPDSFRSGKNQEEGLLMSAYPAGALPFGPLGKIMVPNGGDLAKLPFYPDPYQLLYGPQLLAYPYNLAALPVALNMMAPGGDKVESLPFLPAIFNYAAGPYMGAAPHPLVANPSFYSGGGGGKKQRDSSGSKP